jgi:hypothetical protein
LGGKEGSRRGRKEERMREGSRSEREHDGGYTGLNDVGPPSVPSQLELISLPLDPVFEKSLHLAAFQLYVSCVLLSHMFVLLFRLLLR